MLTRLRALPWGWMIIVLAYAIAVMPIDYTIRVLWVGLAAGAAYLVLAARTTHTTAQLAEDLSQSPLSVWYTAMRSTLINPLLLALPLFTLTRAVQDTPYYFCSTLTRAYCYRSYGVLQWEQVALAIGILAAFLFLDHLLLVSLGLLTRKYLVGSPVLVSRAAVGLRVGLSGLIVGIVALVLTLGGYRDFPYEVGSVETATQQRVVETIYSSFEPLVFDGVFLASNILNRNSYCVKGLGDGSPVCIQLSETRPFILRQLLVTLLASLLYLGLTVGTLSLVMSFRSDSRKKAKRGLVEPETDIAYL